MATANPPAKQPLSLDQLIALSAEIAALARTGIPLDEGLTALGHELPGRLGRVAQEMGAELSAGMPLDQIVARSGAQFPPGYQALIEAGLRSGNLPGILQGMMQLTRKTGDLRRQIILAAVNPLIVVVVTYLLFVFWLLKLAPVYLDILADWEINIVFARQLIGGVRNSMWLWFWLLPALFIGILIWAWRRSNSGTGEWSLLDVPTLGIVRSIGRLRCAGQYGVLCEQLAILLEHGLPLAESLRLCAGTMTSRALSHATLQFAEQLERGATARPPRPFPPLAACIVLDRHHGRALSKNLRQLAANYHDEVRRRGVWLGTWVPAIMTLALGAALAIFHMLVTLGPWIVLMHKMSEAVS